MKGRVEEIKLSTDDQYQLVDITYKVEEKVLSSKIKSGVCFLTIPHATAALIANENEKGVKEDILDRILALAPKSLSYQHDRIDSNAQAHIISSIIGTNTFFIIEKGQLIRGTWQNIFFIELDGPRSNRRVVLKIIGE